jgi:colicin import membrane protein
VKPDKESGSSDADRRIAAAVERRAAQVGKGVGAGATGEGGPISSGPGEGAGGKPTDLLYILYEGRMRERIKAAWAWAGANKSLTVVVQFNITPEGEIKNVRTIESSGDVQYDTSAERAIRAVNPLEPVPEKFRADFATVTLTFQASDLES